MILWTKLRCIPNGSNVQYHFLRFNLNDMYSGESILIRTIWEADPKLWAAPSERIFASDPASHESATPIKHVNQKMQKNLFLSIWWDLPN